MDPEGETLSAEAAVRQNLQQRLLDAVKQCQIRFGARQEIATEADVRVATLCVEWEAVLLHGIKKTKSKAPFKQITGLNKSEVSLWPLAQVCLSQEEVQRFLHLSHITTDIGRGRAWLRAAINERTIENYLHLILAEEGKLRLLYEPHAYLLDQERSTVLPAMAAGLSSILFSISVDAEYLNTPSRSVDVPPVATPLAVGHTSTASSALLEIAPKQNGPQPDGVVAMNRKKKRKKHSVPNGHALSPSHEEPAEREQQSDTAQEVGVATSEPGLAVTDLGSSENLSSSPSMVSMGSEAGPPMFVALDAAMLGNQSSSEAEAEAAASATAMVLSATNTHSSSPPPSFVPSQSSPLSQTTTAHTLSPEELREALLVMVKTKDELEDVNRQLTKQLQQVQAEREQLSMELEQARAELSSLRVAHTSQQALERENDLLKDQLKKMVQRRDTGSARSGDPNDSLIHGLEEALPTEPSPSSSSADPVPSSQDKLSEMADMYGEIMEHNDRLQRDMALKDGYIAKLVNSLHEAGLQVPALVVRQQQNSPDRNLLVDVWIPSVIKKGRGPDAHHIYQVFVRVKDQEWNVYRRYAEFREFHKQLQQCIPEANSFQFPPKKALGNKSAQVVEERRQRLQEYLRFVVRLCTEPRVVKGKKMKHQLDPIMKPSIDRDTLQDILPFFREDLHTATASHNPGLSYSGL